MLKIERLALPLALLVFVTSGCRVAAAPLAPSPSTAAVTQPSGAQTVRPGPTTTAAPTLTPTPEDTPTPAVDNTAVPIDICSPLQGEPIDALAQPNLLKNPFAPPRPGYDDGHFGIDLAYWADAEGKPMLGLPVQAAISGTVAGVIANRQPYGYAVIVETPLERFSPRQLAQLALPTPSSDLQPGIGLSCPEYNFSLDPGATSIYTLYAHLDQSPLVKPGETVECAQAIGAVGTTGRSVNPHLHLETRVGPAGMTFASMAHYDNAASQEEIHLYCLWRISGAFAAFDPLLLLKLP